MLCSSIIKEKMYIGEATVATICGIIFGPHAANLINPMTWGNTDQITLEFSRIVLVVQCFAVGVELPKAYMERHWKSVAFLLIPVMTFGWLATSLFIWAMFNPSLNWLDSLTVAACVTATDPVLASSVVGKGKFAKRVPKHLRDLLSAESGCNDGMAFPFIYLALYIIHYKDEPNHVALHWICVTILYECLFGCIYGVTIGYCARRAIRYAHEKDWVDRESFLVFYFVLALFLAGTGSILGLDDLLVGFAAGVGFSNDGWFTEKTEEAHVSNVIDLLLNLAFFVYFGTIIPWEQFNVGYLNLDVWRLVVIAILVLFFRRIPIMLALKPLIPDVKTWREALFAGHFGPIGVGAIFVSILARGQLETEYESNTPTEDIPEPGFPNRNIIRTIWPITTFLVITSIIVHGSSIAVFTLGKHINTLTLTMSYTQANEQGPSWMERLPRIQSRSKSSMSMQRSDSEYDEKTSAFPPGVLPPIGAPGTFLRRQKEEDTPAKSQSRGSSRHRSRRRSKLESGQGLGGPISQSAIAPASHRQTEAPTPRSDSDTLAVKESPPSSHEREEARLAQQKPNAGPEPEADKHEVSEAGEIFEEGHHTVYEDEEGNVLAVEDSRDEHANEGQQAREDFERREGRRLMRKEHADQNAGVAPTKDNPNKDTADEVKDDLHKLGHEANETVERPGKHWRQGIKKMGTMTGLGKSDAVTKAKKEPKPEGRKGGPARAYQFGNTIIVEDEDGEVIKKYDIPAPDKKQPTPGDPTRSEKRVGQMGRMLGLGSGKNKVEGGTPGPSTDGSGQPATTGGGKRAQARREQVEAQESDDQQLRFTIDAGGRRMSKAEFIDQIRQMDPKGRAQMVEKSSAPEPVKREARADAREQAAAKRGSEAGIPVVPEEPEREHRDSQPQLQRLPSHESGELKLVDSDGLDVPFHDVSSDLRKYQMRSGGGEETAAERRRRQALQNHTAEEDSEDDGTERIPPKPQAGASRDNRLESETGETAAERRRREGALGLREEESDSDDDDTPRQVPQSRGIRFADEVPPPRTQQNEQPQGRQTRLRWGKDRGR